MTDTPDLGPLKTLQRAIFAQLAPLTGTRAGGSARVVALAGGGDVLLPANSYLVPVVAGEALDDRVYKVAPNPATLTAGSLASGQWSGGDWTIPDGDELAVGIQSNVGGAEQNLPANTVLRFDPPVPGLEPTALAVSAITNGTDVHPLFGANLLRRMVFWQTMRADKTAAEFFAAGAGEFPAMLMTWLNSATLQGRTSGGTQGDTRLGRGERAFRERFSCFFGSARYDSADQRRDEGMRAMEAASLLLSDQQNNFDQEQLSSMGSGVEIVERNLAVAERDHFIYQIEFECNATVSKLERRVFGPWLKNHIEALLPPRPAPEPTTPLELVDTIDDMPHA